MATLTDGSIVIGHQDLTIDLVESIKITYYRIEPRGLVPNRLLHVKANLHGAHLHTKTINTTECIFDISRLIPGIYEVSIYTYKVQDAAKILFAD